MWKTIIVSLVVAVVVDTAGNFRMTNRPHEVRWMYGEKQRDYRAHWRPTPDPTNRAEFGFVDDGSLVWRLTK